MKVVYVIFVIIVKVVDEDFVEDGVVLLVCFEVEWESWVIEGVVVEVIY